MESPASVAAEYDPKTDPKRRPAKSNDPGWEYGYWADPKDRDKVTCKLCDKKVPGGIKRFKQHLAGGFGDVVNCPESSPALKKDERLLGFKQEEETIVPRGGGEC